MAIERQPADERSGATPPATPRQSASVILLRDAEAGFELLLVRRNLAQRFMGGYWVFPGGAVDHHEGEGEPGHRRAAVRELREEAGVGGITPAELTRFSRWITPERSPIRFDTHFFLVRAPAGAHARIDGTECVDLRWDTPRNLLAARTAGEIELALPTLRQLEQLSAFADATELLEHARSHEVRPVQPAAREGEIARVVLPGEPEDGA